jgi:hypothetical protein
MATVFVVRQLTEILNDSSPQWVEVNIADQFVQINIFLANNGLETVLKKWPVTPVTAIKTDHISGQQPPHQV